MRSQSNLVRRGTAYYFRKKIPADLRDHYPENQAGEFRVSLGSIDQREAKARAAELAAEKEAEFATKRAALAALAGPPVGELTQEQIDSLSAAWLSHLLEEDEEERLHWSDLAPAVAAP